MFSLESPHRVSYKNTQYTIFNIKNKFILNYPKSGAMGFFPRVVNEPSVFERLTIFLCNSIRLRFEPQKPMEEIKHEFILFIFTPY